MVKWARIGSKAIRIVKSHIPHISSRPGSLDENDLTQKQMRVSKIVYTAQRNKSHAAPLEEHAVAPPFFFLPSWCKPLDLRVSGCAKKMTR
mmetsp:Transcript_81391/g.119208  ORF Transcript_81391/g.119208 Transcript_81391/m.119208 type:complete len:91 (-) Transcript_81391:1018-1290(-)